MMERSVWIFHAVTEGVCTMKSALCFLALVASLGLGLNALVGSAIETAKAQHTQGVARIDAGVAMASR